MARVVILGGGVGGVTTAYRLRKRIPEKDRIIVIDRRKTQYFYPSLPWVMIGERRSESIFRSLSSLPSRGVEFIRDEAVEVIPEQKKVLLMNNPPLFYDFLVLATGADYDYSAYPELARAGFNLWTIEGVTALRRALESFSGGDVVFLIPELPIKGQGAVYEAAFLLKSLLVKRGLQKKFTICICTPENTPLGQFGAAMSEMTADYLVQKGIKLRNNSRLLGIDPSLRRLHFDTGEVGYGLLIYIPPHRGSAVVVKSGFGDEKGWVSADRNYLTTAYDHVFVLGDAATVELPSGGWLPKVGAIATLQSSVVGENIAGLLKGREPARKYNGTVIYIQEIGEGRAVTAIGNMYRPDSPGFRILPPARFWRLGKRYVEYKWLRMGESL